MQSLCRHFRAPIIALALITLLAAPRPARSAEKSQPIPIAPLNRTSTVDFQDEILPILRTSCLACHNRTTTKSGLILETPQTILKGSEDGPVLVPGHSDKSQILDVAAHRDKPVMPPRDNKVSAPDLTSDQLALLKLWIDQGAKGEVRSIAIHWQPIARSFTPAYAVAVTADAQFAAIGRANQLDLYELPSQRLLPPLLDPALAASGPVAHRDMVYSLAFSPDGQYLASGSFGEIKIWRRLATTAGLMFTSGITGAADASPDGKYLALAADNQSIRLTSATTGRTLKTLTGNSAPVTHLRFSPAATELATATAKSLRIWNLADGTASAELTTATEIRAITFSASGKLLAAACADNMIRLFKISDAAPFTLAPGPELKGHTAPITALAHIPASNQLLSASTDGSLRLWNLDNNQSIKQLSHGSPVTAISVRPDGKSFASAGENGIARIWDLAKGAPIAELKGDRALLATAADKDAAQKLAAADTAYDKTLLTKAQADLKAQEDRVKKATEAKTAADKPANEKQAAFKTATAAKTQADKAVTDATALQKKLAEALAAAEKAHKDAQTALDQKSKTTPPPPDLDKLKSAVTAAAKSATDAKAALAKQDAALKQATDRATAAAKAAAAAEDAYKAAERAQANAANELTLASAAVTRANAAIAAAQATIAAAESRQKQAETAAASAKQAAAAPGKPIRAIAFSPDGHTLATAGDDQAIRLWNSETGAPAQTIDDLKSPVVSLSFNSSGLLATSADHTTALWEIAPRFILDRTIGSGDANSPITDRVNALTFSPDGQILASGSGEPSRGGEIKLWNISSGSLLHDFKDTHSDAVLCLAFSRDGARLASGAADRFVKVTDLTTSRVIQSLEGHTHHVLAVSFKADGRTLASSGADGQVKIWDLVAGERKAAVTGFPNEVTSIHFVGISDQAILGCADGQIRVITDAGGAVRTFSNPADHIHAAALSADGKTLLSSGQSGNLYLWDAAGGKLLATLPAPNAPTR